MQPEHERDKPSDETPEGRDFLGFLAYVFAVAGGVPDSELIEEVARVARDEPEEAERVGVNGHSKNGHQPLDS